MKADGGDHLCGTLRPGLERRLKAEVAGEVLFDRFTRGRYATDASHYQMMPLGVVTPRTMDDAERAIAIAREEGVTVLPRGGGTSQCGQTVNDSLVIDCSKYLNRHLDLDVAASAAWSSRASCSTISTAQLKPHGLWFPVDISTASRATIGGMTGNNSCGARSLRYGNTRDNVLSIDAMLADGARRISVLRRVIWPTLPADSPMSAGPRSAGASASAKRRNRGALSESAAPGRRLQSRCAAARTQRHSTSRISWSAPKARSASPRRIELKLVAAARHGARSAPATSAASTKRWMPPSISFG